MKKLLSLLLFSIISTTLHAYQPVDSLRFVYKLHGQTRRFQYVFKEEPGGGLTIDWGIERNLKWWSGTFSMTPEAVKSANSMSFLMPEDGNHVTLPSDMTYAIISNDAYNNLKATGVLHYNLTDYKLTDSSSTTPLGRLLHVTDRNEGAEMWILDRLDYPVVWEMKNNPLEINWKAELLSKPKQDIRGEIAETPGKSGGIYYAYPFDSDVMPQTPAGFKPVAISHYGRHGSRWIIKEWQYPEVMEQLSEAHDSGNLTTLGESLMERVDSIWRFSKGHSGELSPIGEKQHKAIASRLYNRFPTLFADSAVIVALSSTEPRCIVSMAAFCEQLKEVNPSLTIKRHATPGNMDFIAYSTPAAKALGKDDAEWKKRFYSWCDSVIDSDRLMASLFVDPSKVKSPKRLMVLLHNIAVGQQDIESGIDIFDIFTDEELFTLWQHLNYNMYVRHAYAKEGANAGPESARSLLKNIIDTANMSLSDSNAPAITLRFGHDTNLIRLLALMDIEDCNKVESDPDNYYKAWQDYRVSPMGANLQLHFFKNSAGKTIVLVRHNERPVKLPLETSEGTEYFYDWDALSDYWSKKL